MGLKRRPTVLALLWAASAAVVTTTSTARGGFNPQMSAGPSPLGRGAAGVGVAPASGSAGAGRRAEAIGATPQAAIVPTASDPSRKSSQISLNAIQRNLG